MYIDAKFIYTTYDFIWSHRQLKRWKRSPGATGKGIRPRYISSCRGFCCCCYWVLLFKSRDECGQNNLYVVNLKIIHVERRDDLMRYYAFSRWRVSFNNQGDKTLVKPSCKNKLRTYENRLDSFWLMTCRGLSHRSQSQGRLPLSLSSCPFPVPHFPGQGLLISWHNGHEIKLGTRSSTLRNHTIQNTSSPTRINITA